jgi:hypothetical protein
MATPHEGDIGTEIIVDLGEDLTAATTIKMIIMRPTSTNRVMVVDPTAVAGNTVTYKTAAGDLSDAGEYKVQVYYVDPLWSGYSNVITFGVQRHLYDVAASM